MISTSFPTSASAAQTLIPKNSSTSSSLEADSKNRSDSKALIARIISPLFVNVLAFLDLESYREATIVFSKIYPNISFLDVTDAGKVELAVIEKYFEHVSKVPAQVRTTTCIAQNAFGATIMADPPANLIKLLSRNPTNKRELNLTTAWGIFRKPLDQINFIAFL